MKKILIGSLFISSQLFAAYKCEFKLLEKNTSYVLDSIVKEVKYKDVTIKRVLKPQMNIPYSYIESYSLTEQGSTIGFEREGLVIGYSIYSGNYAEKSYAKVQIARRADYLKSFKTEDTLESLEKSAIEDMSLKSLKNFKVLKEAKAVALGSEKESQDFEDYTVSVSCQFY